MGKLKTKVVIIQAYNTPYRNELFNQINYFDDIKLYLVYVGVKTADRQWDEQFESNFEEYQIKVNSKKISFEKNITKLNYIHLIKTISDINPDVIISQLGKQTILLRYILFWKKIKLVHWSEATYVTEKGINWYKKPYLKFNLNLVDSFLFPGKMAKEYHQFCGFNLNNENVFYAPNSVDSIFNITEREFNHKFNQTIKIRFLFIGSYIHRKSFDVLNDAFSYLTNKYENIEFHIAGAGPISPIHGAINHGFVNKSQAVELYKQSHVFIMPSLWDCNPLSVIEAAKCGCILLLSDGVGNYPELVDGNGFVFERANKEAIIEAVENLIKPNNELVKMANKSIELSASINHSNTAKAFYNAIQYSIQK